MIHFFLLYVIIFLAVILKKRFVQVIPIIVVLIPIITSITKTGLLTLDLLLSISCLFVLLGYKIDQRPVLMKMIRPLILLVIIMVWHAIASKDVYQMRNVLRYIAAFSIFISNYIYTNDDSRYQSFLRISWYLYLILTLYVLYSSFLKIGASAYQGSGISSFIYLGSFSLWGFICFVYFFMLFPSYWYNLRVRQYILVPLIVAGAAIVFLITKRNYMIMVSIALILYLFNKPTRYFKLRELTFLVAIVLFSLFVSSEFSSFFTRRYEVRQEAFGVKITEHSRLLELTLYPKTLISSDTKLLSFLFGSGKALSAKEFVSNELKDEGREWHTGIAYLIYGYGATGLVLMTVFFSNIIIYAIKRRRLMRSLGFNSLENQVMILIFGVVFGIYMEWMSNLQSGVIPFSILGSVLGYMDTKVSTHENKDGPL